MDTRTAADFEPRLPARLTSALTPRDVAIASGAVGAMLGTAAWLEGLLGPIRLAGDTVALVLFMSVVMASTLALVSRLLALATRTRRRSRVGPLGTLIVGGIPFGGLNGVIAVLALVSAEAVTKVARGAPWHADPDLKFCFAACVPAAVVGGALGLGYAIGMIPLVACERSYATQPSHDATSRMLLVAGAWMVGIAGACVCLGHADRISWSLAGVVAAAPTTVALALGVGAMTAGWVGVRIRRGWLRRVRAGLLPGWSIGPCLGVADPTLIPLLRDKGPVGDARVVVWTPEASAAYRAHGAVPVALV